MVHVTQKLPFQGLKTIQKHSKQKRNTMPQPGPTVWDWAQSNRWGRGQKPPTQTYNCKNKNLHKAPCRVPQQKLFYSHLSYWRQVTGCTKNLNKPARITTAGEGRARPPGALQTRTPAAPPPHRAAAASTEYAAFHGSRPSPGAPTRDPAQRVKGVEAA